MPQIAACCRCDNRSRRAGWLSAARDRPQPRERWCIGLGQRLDEVQQPRAADVRRLQVSASQAPQVHCLHARAVPARYEGAQLGSGIGLHSLGP